MHSTLFVPLDGSETAQRGLREAIRLARSQGSVLVLWHAIENFPSVGELASSRTMDELLAERRREAQVFLNQACQLASAQGVEATATIDQPAGTVPESILQAADRAGCDLIVMGTHGRSGFSRLALGSVAERVARSSRVPVVLVPPAVAD
jgi:nucleotide-binding universal stress UspA family protein